MLTYFNNGSKTLYIMFRMNEFGNDTLRIGITPRDEKGDQIKDQSVSFYVFRNMNWKTNREGNINYRDLTNFITGIKHIVSEYEKGNPNGEKLQFNDTYNNVKTEHTISFAFGITEKDGVPYRILWIKDKCAKGEINQTYTFRDQEELDRFVKFLKMFLNKSINFIVHMVVSELKETIKDSVGDQIRMIVRDELNAYNMSQSTMYDQRGNYR